MSYHFYSTSGFHNLVLNVISICVERTHPHARTRQYLQASDGGASWHRMAALEAVPGAQRPGHLPPAGGCGEREDGAGPRVEVRVVRLRMEGETKRKAGQRGQRPDVVP